MKKALWLILAGVAIGILVAPDKGSATMKKIKDSLDDLRDKAMDSFDDVVDTGKDMAKKGKQGVKTATHEW
jgi:gas vesicle protein